MLLRHAKSDWPTGVDDHERPLAPRGRHDAPRMAEEMKRRDLVPDLVLVSTAQRTRETFALAAPFLGETAVRYERALYEAEPDAILRLIRRMPGTSRLPLIIGHNPGLELIASHLIGAGPERLRDRLGEKFPTASLAVIAFPHGDWADVGRGKGRLSLFLTPADIE
jgi:phosphohistidine phosphatase